MGTLGAVTQSREPHATRGGSGPRAAGGGLADAPRIASAPGPAGLRLSGHLPRSRWPSRRGRGCEGGHGPWSRPGHQPSVRQDGACTWCQLAARLPVFLSRARGRPPEEGVPSGSRARWAGRWSRGESGSAWAGRAAGGGCTGLFVSQAGRCTGRRPLAVPLRPGSPQWGRRALRGRPAKGGLVLSPGSLCGWACLVLAEAVGWDWVTTA